LRLLLYACSGHFQRCLLRCLPILHRVDLLTCLTAQKERVTCYAYLLLPAAGMPLCAGMPLGIAR